MVRVFIRKEARRTARQRDAQRRREGASDDPIVQLRAAAAAAARARREATPLRAAAVPALKAAAVASHQHDEPRYLGARDLRAYKMRCRETRHNAIVAYQRRYGGIGGMWRWATGLGPRAIGAIHGKGARRVRFAECPPQVVPVPCKHKRSLSDEDLERLHWSKDDMASFQGDACARFGFWLRLGGPAHLWIEEELKDEADLERCNAARALVRLSERASAPFQPAPTGAAAAVAVNPAEDPAAAVVAGHSKVAATAPTPVPGTQAVETDDFVMVAALLSRLMAVRRSNCSAWYPVLGKACVGLLPPPGCRGNAAAPMAAEPNSMKGQ